MIVKLVDDEQVEAEDRPPLIVLMRSEEVEAVASHLAPQLFPPARTCCYCDTARTFIF